MKLIIDEDQCLKQKLTLEEFLIAFVFRQIKNPNEVSKNLINREVLTRQNGQILVTQHWSEVMDEVLADSQGVEKSDEELEALAKKMRELYPEGRMIDRLSGKPTPYYFRCNVPEITKRLKTFFTRYGDYSDEEILDATRRYVASWHGDYQQPGFRLIKYFIWKDDPKRGPDGNYVDSISPLLDLLSNKDDDSTVSVSSDDWTVKLV